MKPRSRGEGTASSIRRRLLAPGLALPLLFALPASTAVAPSPPAGSTTIPDVWRTRAERTNFRETGTYDETMAFCRALQKASPWVRLASYGRSQQGRDLPLVILSKDHAFTPDQARTAGKPVVLIQNGIHSGEIEGKDASLALMRDLAVTRTRADLLDHVTLLVLPIFSVDAHERRGRFNRINQNGPEEMGWRFTPVGLNLNRDYLKVETPEMRALVSCVFTRWWPDLLVDDHTTDGADFQYDVTYGFNRGPGTPAPVTRWMIDAIEGRVAARVTALGHVVGPYISFHADDPRQGLDLGDAPPRFSSGYPPLHGRAALLVETHMLKPYGARVKATYDLLVAVLEELNARPRELLDAVAASESLAIARGREADPARRRVVLATRLSGRSEPFPYRGVDTRYEWSDVTGAAVPRYGAAPRDTVVPLYRDLEPALEVTQPVGYLVPQEWTVVADRLAVHGVRFQRLRRAWADSVEVQRITDWSAAPRSSEGHHPVTVREVRIERQWRAFRPGDLWVPLDQRSALVAVHLLEAQAPDGLLYWNAFDTVLEPKEYAEDYVMEPIARRMMAEEPALARDFKARLAADSSFAKDPAARVDFFFRRSRWADPEQNLHPAARALRAPPADALGE